MRGDESLELEEGLKVTELAGPEEDVFHGVEGLAPRVAGFVAVSSRALRGGGTRAKGDAD